MAAEIPSRQLVTRAFPYNPRTSVLLVSAVLALIGLVALSNLALVVPDEPVSMKVRAESAGPSVTLLAMMALARQEALNVDETAAFGRLYVLTPGYLLGTPYSGPVIGSLELDFTFYASDGRHIDVSLEDASPASTVDVRVSGAVTGGAYNRDYQDAREREAGTLRSYTSFALTPRDAVLRTWQEAQEYVAESGWLSGRQGVSLLPSVSPVYDNKKSPGWSVIYWLQPQTEPPTRSHLLSFPFGFMAADVVEFEVDAQTGAIVALDYNAPPTPIVPGTPVATGASR